MQRFLRQESTWPRWAGQGQESSSQGGFAAAVTCFLAIQRGLLRPPHSTRGLISPQSPLCPTAWSTTRTQPGSGEQGSHPERTGGFLQWLYRLVQKGQVRAPFAESTAAASRALEGQACQFKHRLHSAASFPAIKSSWHGGSKSILSRSEIQFLNRTSGLCSAKFNYELSLV